VIPTFNEGGNVEELVRRLGDALRGRAVEVLFVDDSTDDTPSVIRDVSTRSAFPVKLLHRDEPTGGLSGAVLEGLRSSDSDYVVVMDGDLQHPPEMAALLLDTAAEEGADLVVASRYLGEGDASGLSSNFRRSVSTSSTLLAKACFPRRVGRVCTDPMTGFFCFRRTSVHLDRLRPRGFKILLEVLARHDLRVREIPFVFGERLSGQSKASWRNGIAFLHQMLSLRMGRMGRFAAVGALGTVWNLLLMAALLDSGVHYLPSAVVASELTIIHNFLMQERFVFRDLRDGEKSFWRRGVTFLAFNNAEALVRLPVLAALVSGIGLAPLLAQGLTLATAFVLRFVFVSQVVYRPPDDRPPFPERAPGVQAPRNP
jgi:dolichol-phosphate mannosyltransferase